MGGFSQAVATGNQALEARTKLLLDQRRLAKLGLGAGQFQTGLPPAGQRDAVTVGREQGVPSGSNQSGFEAGLQAGILATISALSVAGQHSAGQSGPILGVINSITHGASFGTGPLSGVLRQRGFFG